MEEEISTPFMLVWYCAFKPLLLCALVLVHWCQPPPNIARCTWRWEERFKDESRSKLEFSNRNAFSSNAPDWSGAELVFANSTCFSNETMQVRRSAWGSTYVHEDNNFRSRKRNNCTFLTISLLYTLAPGLLLWTTESRSHGCNIYEGTPKLWV